MEEYNLNWLYSLCNVLIPGTGTILAANNNLDIGIGIMQCVLFVISVALIVNYFTLGLYLILIPYFWSIITITRLAIKNNSYFFKEWGGIISLVISILAVVLCWTRELGLVLGLIGLVISLSQIKTKNNLIIASIVLSVIAIVLSFIFLYFHLDCISYLLWDMSIRYPGTSVYNTISYNCGIL